VHFTGFRSDVARWMQAMDVVALTSVAHESLSMVLIEALTLGRPTVGTRVGGAHEIIEDGVTGDLVEPADPHALACAIDKLLRSDRQALSQRAAADAMKRFSAERFAQNVASVYDLVSHATHGRG
jgi:glycosyltransferase involved in cell wall biosynthesis